MDNINSNYLNNIQVNETIDTKYLALGYRHVDTSGLEMNSHSRAPESSTVP